MSHCIFLYKKEMLFMNTTKLRCVELSPYTAARPRVADVP